MREYEESKGSLEGLRKEDVSYFVDRILERDEDQRIKIEPLDHSYGIEWEPSESQEDKEGGFYDDSSGFDRLRRSLLHSSPRKDEPEYRDIVDRRLEGD